MAQTHKTKLSMLISVCLLSACLGGETVGTGVGFTSPTADREYGTTTRLLQGVIVTTGGTPASGAVLHVYTTESFYSARSGPTGAFSIRVSDAAARMLSVSIEHEGRLWKTRIPFPAAERVSLRFTLASDGTVLLE